MDYRIEYTNDGAKHRKISPIRRRRLFVYALMGIGVTLLIWWTHTNTELLAALENMAQQVGDGMPIGDALEAFCIDIFQGAEGG